MALQDGLDQPARGLQEIRHLTQFSIKVTDFLEASNGLIESILECQTQNAMDLSQRIIPPGVDIPLDESADPTYKVKGDPAQWEFERARQAR